ncbi:MAG: peptidoglycan-binding domain-containing protein [Leptospirales bacterium]|jgi:peptidoglycan hydrolase-like protein with peptidoglycan-binding domain
MSNTYDAKSVQEGLSICGHSPGAIDGKMGPNTQNAIKAFQKSAGVAVDGIMGPNTAAALAKILGEKSVRASGLKGYFEGGGGAGAAGDM